MDVQRGASRARLNLQHGFMRDIVSWLYGRCGLPSTAASPLGAAVGCCRVLLLGVVGCCGGGGC